jgi:hypothetical protein
MFGFMLNLTKLHCDFDFAKPNMHFIGENVYWVRWEISCIFGSKEGKYHAFLAFFILIF